MTEPRKIPTGQFMALPGARTSARHANREQIMINVRLPRCAEPITLVEASNFITMIIDNDCLKMIGLAIYEPDKSVALLHTLTCDEARQVAESLVQLAAAQEQAAGDEAARKLAAMRAAGKGGAA
jgi:hypothetical protein